MQAGEKEFYLLDNGKRFDFRHSETVRPLRVDILTPFGAADSHVSVSTLTADTTVQCIVSVTYGDAAVDRPFTVTVTSAATALRGHPYESTLAPRLRGLTRDLETAFAQLVIPAEAARIHEADPNAIYCVRASVHVAAAGGAGVAAAAAAAVRAAVAAATPRTPLISENAETGEYSYAFSSDREHLGKLVPALAGLDVRAVEGARLGLDWVMDPAAEEAVAATATALGVFTAEQPLLVTSVAAAPPVTALAAAAAADGN